MVFKLFVVSGKGEGTEIGIEPPTIIGRSSQADVRVGHPLVSRKHCEITVHDEDGLLVVEDLGSLNGTYHGSERITEPVYLEPGDRLTVGETVFEARYGDFQSNGNDATAVAAPDSAPDFNFIGASDASSDPANDTPQIVIDTGPVSDVAPDQSADQQDGAPVLVESADTAGTPSGESVGEPLDQGDTEDAEVIEVSEFEEVAETEEVRPVEEVSETVKVEPVEDVAEVEDDKVVVPPEESSDEKDPAPVEDTPGGFDWLPANDDDAGATPASNDDSHLNDFFKGLQ